MKVGLKPDELEAIIGEYDALAVRSATKVTAKLLEKATRLKVVGRAGVGVDNVDLDAATRRGVVVMNTPGGSSTTVAELALAHDAGARAPRGRRPPPASRPASGRRRSSRGTSCPARRWAWSASATSARWWSTAPWRSRCRSWPTTRSSRADAAAEAGRRAGRLWTSCGPRPTSSRCTCRSTSRPATWSTPACWPR